MLVCWWMKKKEKRTMYASSPARTSWLGGVSLSDEMYSLLVPFSSSAFLHSLRGSRDCLFSRLILYLLFVRRYWVLVRSGKDNILRNEWSAFWKRYDYCSRHANSPVLLIKEFSTMTQMDHWNNNVPVFFLKKMVHIPAHLVLAAFNEC
jgi:hypothetical protein